MTLVFVLMAGMVMGIWHCREVEAARRAAYRAGQAQARQALRTARWYGGRDALPVPGYSQAEGIKAETADARSGKVMAIARAAVSYGRAAGRVQ